MEKKYHYIIKLNLPTLIKILRENRQSKVGGVTYIEQTGTVSLLLKLLKAVKAPAFPMEKIQPRSGPSGPVLNVANVRNEKGEVIIIDLYHHVLKIRMQILEQLKKAFGNTGFFKGKKNISMITSCFGLKIAEDITPTVYLAHYARCKQHEKAAVEKSHYTLVIPQSPWSDSLILNLGDQVDKIVVSGGRVQTVSQFFRISRHAARAVVHSLYLSLIKPFQRGRGLNRNEKSKSKAKIMVAFRMGVLKDKRNDLSFYHSSQLESERMLLFFRSSAHIPSKEEMEWMNQEGINCIAAVPPDDSSLNIPVWRPSPLFKRELSRLYIDYLGTLFKCIGEKCGKGAGKKSYLWMLGTFWDIEIKNVFWKDFFFTNNVNILVNSIPSDNNFITNLAISEINGIAVEFERSIRFDYCTYIHNSPNHVYFATGPYSLKQFYEPSFSLFTVLTGGINISDKPGLLPGAAQLRKNSEFVITLFDEIPTDWFFGETIDELYRSVLGLLEKDQRFSLLIKTKKPHVFQKLSGLSDVDAIISGLIERGRCLMADWKITPYAAAFHSDLVVSVASTAAFESILAGTRTIIFNPQRAGSKIFYSNNALNRRIFEDSRLMIDAILRYANGQDDSIGDCSDIFSLIDPFGDGKGAERMGKYLQWCLEGLDTGQRGETVLEKANELYVQQWGEDKVTNENAYETPVAQGAY